MDGETGKPKEDEVDKLICAKRVNQKRMRMLKLIWKLIAKIK